MVFLFDLEGRRLLNARWKRPDLKVTIGDAKNVMAPVQGDAAAAEIGLLAKLVSSSHSKSNE